MVKTSAPPRSNGSVEVHRRLELGSRWISPDPVDRLVEFAGRDGLSYPLASDEGRQVMAAYGAHGEKNLYGRTVTAVIRSSVVLAPDGTIAHKFVGPLTEAAVRDTLMPLVERLSSGVSASPPK